MRTSRDGAVASASTSPARGTNTSKIAPALAAAVAAQGVEVLAVTTTPPEQMKPNIERDDKDTPARLRGRIRWDAVKPVPTNGVVPPEWEEKKKAYVRERLLAVREQMLLDLELLSEEAGGGGVDSRSVPESAAALQSGLLGAKQRVGSFYARGSVSSVGGGAENSAAGGGSQVELPGSASSGAGGANNGTNAPKPFTDTLDWAQRPHLIDPETGKPMATRVQCVLRIKDWSISKTNEHEYCKMEGFLEMHWYDYRFDVANYELEPDVVEEIRREVFPGGGGEVDAGGMGTGDARERQLDRLLVSTTAEQEPEAGINAKTQLVLPDSVLVSILDDLASGLKQMQAPPESTWRAQLMASYGTNMEKGEKYTELPRFYANAERNGKLTFDPKFFFSNDGVNLGADLDRLRAFPFDSVRIDVSIFFVGKRSDTINEILPSFQRPNLARKLEDGFSGKFQQLQMNCVKHSGDYELFRMSYGEGFLCANWAAENPVIRSSLIFSVHLKRTPGFYLQKGILPLYLCGFFGLVTFLTEPIELTGRLQMLFALFLTSFAIQWVTLERLPRLPFNTVLDDVVLHVVVSLFVGGIGQAASYRLGRELAQGSSILDSSAEGADDVSTRLNRFDFVAAFYLDCATGAVILLYLTFYSVLGRFRKAYREGYSGNTTRAGNKNKTTGSLRPWVAGKDYRNKAVRPVAGNLWSVDLTDDFVKHGSFLGMGTLVEPEEF